MENLDDLINELIKKADEAQRRGDYEEMKRLDKILENLHNKKMELFHEAIDKERNDNDDRDER